MVVSSNTELIAKTLYSLLDAEPININNNNDLFVNKSLLLVSPREDSSTDIGAANLVLAKALIEEQFISALQWLIKHNYIKLSPEEQRRQFRLIDNTGVYNDK